MGFSRQENWSGLPFRSPVDHILSELSTMTRLSWVALHGMAHSFIDLDKAVVHVISLISCLWLWFSFCLPSWIRKRLMEASWWQRLTEVETGSVLLSGAMLHKSLIQFSVDGWGCVPSLCFGLRPNNGNSGSNGDLPPKDLCQNSCIQCLWPHSSSVSTHASDEGSRTLSGKSAQSLVGSLLLSPGSWCSQRFVCALQESVSPVL